MSEEKKQPPKPKTLPEDVAKKYELTGGHEAGKFLLPRGRGTIDLSTISMEQAAKLAEDKSIPFFQVKSVSSGTSSKPVGQ